MNNRTFKIFDNYGIEPSNTYNNVVRKIKKANENNFANNNKDYALKVVKNIHNKDPKYFVYLVKVFARNQTRKSPRRQSIKHKRMIRAYQLLGVDQLKLTKKHLNAAYNKQRLKTKTKKEERELDRAYKLLLMTLASKNVSMHNKTSMTRADAWNYHNFKIL